MNTMHDQLVVCLISRVANTNQGKPHNTIRLAREFPDVKGMIFILNPNPTSLSFKESWSFNMVLELSWGRF